MIEPDAADRLTLDESASARHGAPEVTVIGDESGALTLALLAAGTPSVRAHQDSVSGERALLRAARERDVAERVRILPLGRDLVLGARIVLLRLPRALAALGDMADSVAAEADAGVTVVAGGRIKHMSLGMNDVLRERFGILDVSHARQKSRVLIARSPRRGRTLQPSRARIAVPRLAYPVTVCAYGGVFAGASLDIGTRLLLEHLPDDLPQDLPAIDLACGTGVIATWLALRHPGLRVVASDQSAAAVASTHATADENRVSGRVEVVRDDALAGRPDDSAGFIALNPPFHAGAAVDATLARHLFEDSARVLAPGGELWCVWNSHLRYRGTLEQVVGPTRQVARNAKFTVTVSTAR